MARTRPPARGPQPPAPAVLSPVVLPELRPADRSALLGRDDPDGAELDGLDFDGVDLGDLELDGAELLDCRFAGCRLDGTRLRRGRLVSCVLTDVHATTLDVADSSWRDVLVRDSRIGALTAHGVELRSVTVEGGKLDYVNLRAADLTRVRFRDARIGELDLGSATVTDVRFDGCSIERLVLGGAACSDVHLEHAELAAVEGIGSLAGVVVSEIQLTLLAPALAAHVGLTVAPG